MATMADHYTNLLGPVYTWMVGDVDAALARSDLELDALSLPSQGAGTAVDLGAGFGMHAIPLARRGFSVVAIDSYQPLLQELAVAGGFTAHPHRQRRPARLSSRTPRRPSM